MDWIEILISAIPEWFGGSGNPIIIDILITAIPDFFNSFADIVVKATPGGLMHHSVPIFALISGVFILIMWNFDYA